MQEGSPEIPCAHNPASGPLPPRVWCRNAAASTRRRRADGPRDVESTPPRLSRCRDDATRPGPASRREWRRARRSWLRDACRADRARRRAATPPPVPKAIRAVVPAGTTIRWRSANTGSRTVPAVLDRRRPSTTASGALTSRPRPRKRARSVPNSSLARAQRLRYDGMLSRPNVGFVGGALSAHRERRVQLGDILRLHEELQKGPDEPRRRQAGRGTSSE